LKAELQSQAIKYNAAIAMLYCCTKLFITKTLNEVKRTRNAADLMNYSRRVLDLWRTVGTCAAVQNLMTISVGIHRLNQ
jgi:hypothetical protein